MKASDAIHHIEQLYPPDSEYDDTRKIGRELMDNVVGNKVGYNNWRQLSDIELCRLARANLIEAGEYGIYLNEMLDSLSCEND
jgi:hypothetical protein